MFKNLKFGIILSTLVTLSGCVGVAYLPPTKKLKHTIQHPRILYNVGEIKATNLMNPPYTNFTKLTSIWGEPDSITTTKDGYEEWTYNRDLRWGGVVVCVIIPIPLLVPVGYNKTILTLEDGIITKGEYFVRGEGKEAILYLFPIENVGPF